jgi:hypothetical protein
MLVVVLVLFLFLSLLSYRASLLRSLSHTDSPLRISWCSIANLMDPPSALIAQGVTRLIACLCAQTPPFLWVVRFITPLSDYLFSALATSSGVTASMPAANDDSGDIYYFAVVALHHLFRSATTPKQVRAVYYSTRVLIPLVELIATQPDHSLLLVSALECLGLFILHVTGVGQDLKQTGFFQHALELLNHSSVRKHLEKNARAHIRIVDSASSCLPTVCFC